MADLLVTAASVMAEGRCRVEGVGAKTALAKALGISRQQLWNQLHLRPGTKVLQWLGYEKVVGYRKVHQKLEMANLMSTDRRMVTPDLAK